MIIIRGKNYYPQDIEFADKFELNSYGIALIKQTSIPKTSYKEFFKIRFIKFIFIDQSYFLERC
jgi:hypothetical protein